MDLTRKKCVPCEDKNTPPLTEGQARGYLGDVPGWQLSVGAKKITRTWLFDDFVSTMRFVNRVAELAESEGHHPDISVFYNRLLLGLWTHSIGGLSENDFILAAKINALG